MLSPQTRHLQAGLVTCTSFDALTSHDAWAGIHITHHTLCMHNKLGVAIECQNEFFAGGEIKVNSKDGL